MSLKLNKINASEFLKAFNIMQKSFPRDEYRSEEKQRALFSDPRYTVLTYEQGDKTIGFLAMWELEDIGFIEHFAVLPEMRGGGIGSQMLEAAVEYLGKTVCLEVELPETETAKRRIGFYSRNGFYLNDYDYVQPAFSSDKNPVPLKIMTTGGKINESEFLNIKNRLYKDVYKVKK